MEVEVEVEVGVVVDVTRVSMLKTFLCVHVLHFIF